ncbi:hypothetical protein DFH08DRAFT_817303 [Mycena albidolilacea]|uniref:Uncharacterized protein n=1 Tax=Mycena albidolilacea TaxID=1033008 RepID=A0AAD6ZIQ2_9AGAR|nr:hypothetical protein DFH08DRAFT_817303 [Mycena albidolilacea]
MITRFHNFVVGVPARVHEGENLDWRRAQPKEETRRIGTRLGSVNGGLRGSIERLASQKKSEGGERPAGECIAPRRSAGRSGCPSDTKTWKRKVWAMAQKQIHNESGRDGQKKGGRLCIKRIEEEGCTLNALSFSSAENPMVRWRLRGDGIRFEAGKAEKHRDEGDDDTTPPVLAIAMHLLRLPFLDCTDAITIAPKQRTWTAAGLNHLWRKVEVRIAVGLGGSQLGAETEMRTLGALRRQGVGRYCAFNAESSGGGTSIATDDSIPRDGGWRSPRASQVQEDERAEDLRDELVCIEENSEEKKRGHLRGAGYKARGGKGRVEAGQWWAWRHWRRRSRQGWCAAAAGGRTLGLGVACFGCRVGRGGDGDERGEGAHFEDVESECAFGL